MSDNDDKSMCLLHTTQDYRPGLNDLGFQGQGNGKGHVLGRLTGNKVLNVPVTFACGVVGTPVDSAGDVARQGKLRTLGDLPSQSPGAAKGGEYLVQCIRIRKHITRCQRALQRARDDDHKALLNSLIEADILKLKNVQAMVIEGKINLKVPLKPRTPKVMLLLPRGSVPRGFNR